jgi:cytochrome P450
MTTSHPAAPLPDGPKLSETETTFRWLAHPYELLDECARDFGDVFTLRFGHFGTHVLLSDPNDVRDVLAGDRDVLFAGRGNALLEPILGKYSLLLLDGDRHLSRRALLQPAFRPDRVQSYGGIVAKAARKWTASWDTGVVKVQRTALDISKEVILRVTLGIEDEGEIARLSQLIHELMLVVGTNSTFDQSSDERVLQRFRTARGALAQALQEHVERRQRATSDGEDVLSMLIAAEAGGGEQLSDEEIRDQLITMILAGHETTASSITWALVCLDAQPAAMERLERELNEAAGVADEQLAGLPYLQAVCLETLRMRPVIPVVARELQLPFRIRGMTLPAGVFVTPCSYLAHRRPQAFPLPDTFKPERFLEQRYSPYEYFPFGGGVHRCLGMSFALLELQIVLGVLVRTFRFASGGAVRPVRRAVTIVASGGGKMRVERRAA